jgi:hypothetical protein
MQTKNLIALDEFCANHSIEISFITLLQHTGLIEIKTIQESVFIDADQLRDLEKMVRLFYELDINLEGIETINHLLQRINSLHNEITELKNRLRFYETNE